MHRRMCIHTHIQSNREKGETGVGNKYSLMVETCLKGKILIKTRNQQVTVARQEEGVSRRHQLKNLVALIDFWWE